MATWIYKLTPARPEMLLEGPTDEEKRIIADHAAYLRELSNRGVVTLFGRTDTVDASTFGIVVFTAADRSAAEAIMRADPGVEGGLHLAELFPFRQVWPPVSR